ncbi:MAG: 2-phospho-L-lactate transferase [Candidatus Binataceae bacterium]
MGAAKFIRGLVRVVAARRLVVVVNTADDDEFYGLHVSPDLDTVTYTLAGVENRVHGWGRDGDTFNALGALARFYGKPWFMLGDRDLATHIYRSQRLRDGATLCEVTAEIAERFGVAARVLPMSNDAVRTFIKLKRRPAMAFQEYLVRNRAHGEVEGIELRGLSSARALPEVLHAIRGASAIILAPSNPFVSLGPILGLRGIRAALRAARARVAAISPIVGGRTIKGPADRMLRGLGLEVSAVGVARLYGDIAGTFVIDKVDQGRAGGIERLGMRAVVADTIMSSAARTERLARVVLNSLRV